MCLISCIQVTKSSLSYLLNISHIHPASPPVLPVTSSGNPWNILPRIYKQSPNWPCFLAHPFSLTSIMLLGWSSQNVNDYIIALFRVLQWPHLQPGKGPSPEQAPHHPQCGHLLAFLAAVLSTLCSQCPFWS